MDALEFGRTPRAAVRKGGFSANAVCFSRLTASLPSAARRDIGRRGTAAKPIVEVVPYEKVKHSLVDGQRPPMWCVYDFRFLTWSKAAAGAIMIGLRRLMSISVPVAMFLLVFADHGFGQALVGGQTALDNAGGAGARSPGNMVSAGVAQTLDFGGHVTIITEQAATDGGLLAQTIAASLDILFEQLNQALLLFHNLLLARAGRPPAIPGLGLEAVRIKEPRPGNLVQTARLQAKARRSPR